VKKIFTTAIVIGHLLLVSFAVNLYAQTSSKSGIHSITTVNVEHLGLNPDSAKELGLGKYANSINLSYRRANIDNGRLLNMGVGLVYYDDNAQFNETVNINGTSATDNRNSQVQSLSVEADYGLLKLMGAQRNHYWTLRGGYTGLPFGKRTTKKSNEICSGCREENVNIKGGAYGVIGIGHYFEKAELSLEYRQYVSGDLNNSIRLGFGYGF
jgi:hypothetical protein